MLVIDRWAECEFGVFGNIHTYDGGSLYTLEPRWLNNKPFVSCIPVGQYPIFRDNFRGKYPNFRLEEVPDRWAIEMHRANVYTELQGCIALGTGLGFMEEMWALQESEKAMDIFMESMGDIEADRIEIRWKHCVECGSFGKVPL
jgi:hypothetical protein